MARIILSLLVSYFLGSIPSAYILGRAFKGIDIRKYGSGNIGATNAFRVLGPIFGSAALLFDIAKGLICATLVASFLGLADNLSWGLSLRIILGVSAVIGHNWTLFLNFKGGKGVATSLGVIIGLAIVVSPLRVVLILVILAWIATFLSTGFVSLASIVSASLFPLSMLFLKAPVELAISSVILAIFIIFRHKPNIHRLLRNEEHRFNPLNSFRKIFSRVLLDGLLE
jgi:glycerol-3-phosphate acyltransferase PlsY